MQKKRKFSLPKDRNHKIISHKSSATIGQPALLKLGHINWSGGKKNVSSTLPYCPLKKFLVKLTGTSKLTLDLNPALFLIGLCQLWQNAIKDCRRKN